MSRHPRLVVCHPPPPTPSPPQLRKFVSLFTGEYIYRKLKWEWKEAKEDEEDDDEEEEEVATGAPCTVAN